MPNTLRIKRRATGGGAGAPSGLANAELAYNEQTNILYYGWGIGGAGGTATQAIPIAGSGSYTFVDGSNANGTWPISINGNSATVTNGVYTSRTLTAGSGLVGGGDLSSNRSFDIGQGDGISVSADSIAVDSSVVRTTGTQTINGSKTFGDTITFSSGLSVNSQKITNLATPTADTDAATKAYVDAARAGLDVKQSVRVATTQSLTALSTGASFSTNTISGTNVGALSSIDGISLSTNDRILVKDETTNAAYNGIYTVSSLGGAGSSWQLMRATDADSSAEVTAGMFTFVTEGTINSDSGWVLTTNDTITLNTTSLSFAQFSGAGQITAVSGISKNGNTLFLSSAYGDTINPYGSKTANTVLAAPNGSAGVPSFRNLVPADFPVGSTANLPIITTTNGVLSAGSFGTGANTFCQGNDSRLSDTRNTTNSLTVNNAGAGTASPFTFNGSAAQTLSYNSIGAPSISGANAVGTWNIAITGNAGTVTNGVYTSRNITASSGLTGGGDLSVDRSLQLGTPSNITLSSTNSVTATSHTHAFAPGGTTSQYIRGDGVATSGGALSKTDDTNVTLTLGGSPTNSLLSAVSLTLGWTGNLAVNRGGTGQTSYVNGELLIGNSTGNTLTKATLTQGSGLSITNGPGSITMGHGSTSTLSGVYGTNGISSITLDSFGHVTTVSTATYLTSATVCTAIADCTIDGGTF